MSLTLNFTPHSWYMGFAIKDNRAVIKLLSNGEHDKLNETDYLISKPWSAYTDNGMAGYVDELHARTLKELKLEINDYYKRKDNPLYRR